MALPPIVKLATIAVVIKVIKNKFIDVVFDIKLAIVTAVEPDITPHISPITSQQKLDTLSLFFLNNTAILAPFTFLEFIEWNIFSSAVVTLTPIISNKTPRSINNSDTIIPITKLKFGTVTSDTKDSEKLIENDIIIIVSTHRLSTNSFYIFSLLLV